MVIEYNFGDGVALLHQQAELALLIARVESFRKTHVALGIGADLGQLSMLVAVATGSADIAGALQNQKSHRLRGVVVAVHDAARNHQVVAAPEWQIAELRFEHAFAVPDIDELAALSVPVEEIVFTLH